MWHSVTRKPPTELGESLKISARFLFFRFVYSYQYIAHSTNDISTIHFLLNLLKSSFLLWNKPTKSRTGSCTHFKLFNDFQSIFGIARNSNDITDIQEQWSIWEGEKKVSFIPQKQNTLLELSKNQCYLSWTGLIKNLRGILCKTRTTCSKP